MATTEADVPVYAKSDFKNLKLDIYTIGIGFPRFNNILFWDNNKKVLVSGGPQIFIWDLESRSKVGTLSIHQNVIYCLAQNDSYIFSIAYSGEIAVLNKPDLKVLKVHQSAARNNRNYSVTNEHLLLSFEEQYADLSDKNGITEVYQIEQLLKQGEEAKCYSLKGKYRYGDLLDDSCFFTLSLKKILPQQEEKSLKSNASSQTQEEPGKKGEKKVYYTYTAQIFNFRTGQEVMKGEEISIGQSDIITKEYYHAEKLSVFLTNNKEILIFDCEKCTLLYRGFV